MKGLLQGLVDAGRFARLREAAVIPDGLDPADEPLYRRLNQGSRDLPKYQHRRVQEAAVRGWIANPFARRLVEMPKDYMIAEGVAPVSTDPALQVFLEEFWADPITRMDAMVDTIALESELLGEVALPLFIAPDGRSRVTMIDTLLITDTIPDPGNTRVIIGVKLGGSAGVDAFVLPTLLGPAVDDPSVLSPEAVGLREKWRARLPAIFKGTAPVGVLYWGLNRIAGMTRGLSGLSGSLDHADRLDTNLFDMLERTGLMSAFVWAVTIEGATPEEIKAWQSKYAQPPRPGSVRVGNEKEKWEAVTPDLKLGDLTTGFRTARNYIAANQGLAPSWMGDVDGTRANADVQGDPTIKTMTGKQNRLKGMLLELLRQVVWEAVSRGKLPPTALDKQRQPVDAWRTVGLVMPEMNPKDMVRVAGALLQVSQAVSVAVAAGALSKATGTRLLSAVAPHLGVDVDAEEEILAAVEDSSSQAAADVTQLYAQLATARGAAALPPAPAEVTNPPLLEALVARVAALEVTPRRRRPR